MRRFEDIIKRVTADGNSLGADTELLCVSQVQISLLFYCWGPVVTGNTGNTGNTGYVSHFFPEMCTEDADAKSWEEEETKDDSLCEDRMQCDEGHMD